jgi:predicted glycoside hydrolase/deacetylase ChbG (UPF0249 family)
MACLGDDSAAPRQGRLRAINCSALTVERMSGPLVLVNADDFGSSSGVNCAIADAFRSDLIDTCTIMANFPAFEEACEAAHAGGFAARIGLHFVLDAGVPLTEKLRREPRFCGPDGLLLPRRCGTLIRLSLSEQRAVAAEMCAQIARCRSYGLPLTHIDSHHHIHEELGIIGVVVPIMREQGIMSIRPMQNLRRCRTLIRRMYTCAFNIALRTKWIARTRYFGSLSDYLTFVSLNGAPPPNSTIELMVHPTIGPAGVIVDAGQNASLSDAVSTVSKYRRPAVPTGVPAR